MLDNEIAVKGRNWPDPPMSLVDTSFGFVKYCISKATTSICPKSHKVLQTNFKVGPELNRKNGCEKILCTAQATHFKFAGYVPSPTYLLCTNLQVTKETEHYTVQPQKNNRLVTL